MSVFSRREFLLSGTSAGVGMLALPAVPARAALVLPIRKDLRPFQTPIKNQGARGSCIVFAAVAALEASLKRTLNITVDISEEFTNFLGKSLWLHPNHAEVLARGPDGAETQIGWTSGGGGTWVLEWFCKGFRAPDEVRLPYVPSVDIYRQRWALASTAPFPEFPQVKQTPINNFNLSTKMLARPVLERGSSTILGFYAGRGFTRVTPPTSANIRAALALGYEVVTDFGDVAHKVDVFKIWQPVGGGSGAHSMLIVGYDYSVRGREHFIVKNSWGLNPEQPDGYTLISPAMIDVKATGAGYITGAYRTNWPELPLFGRWRLFDDGLEGRLDIHHLPGLAKPAWEQWPPPTFTGADRRIGSYTGPNGVVYKVNGSVGLQTYGVRTYPVLEFWLDPSNTTPDYAAVGRGIRYVLVMTDNFPSAMTGWRQVGGLGPKIPVHALHEDTTFFAGPGLMEPIRSTSLLGTTWNVLMTTPDYPAAFTARFDTTATTLSNKDLQIGVTLSYRLSTGVVSGRGTATVSPATPRRFILTTPARFPFDSLTGATLDMGHEQFGPRATTGVASIGGVVRSVLMRRI